MTPQNAGLNRVGWRMLEARIQDLAESRRDVWVITGPAFIDDDGDGIVEYFVIGENQVAVPTHYYKIVVARKTDGTNDWDAMAFLLPNEKMENEIGSYLVPIREIESVTGFDFLSGLPDAEERVLESATAEGAIGPNDRKESARPLPVVSFSWRVSLPSGS